MFQGTQTTKNTDYTNTGQSVTCRNTWKCSKDPHYDDIVSEKQWIAFHVVRVSRSAVGHGVVQKFTFV